MTLHRIALLFAVGCALGAAYSAHRTRQMLDRSMAQTRQCIGLLDESIAQTESARTVNERLCSMKAQRWTEKVIP